MSKCNGTNCAATDGVSHSAECQAEHAALCAAAEGADNTPSAAPDERAAFEAHWYNFYHSGSISARADGTYFHPSMNCAWDAWQARAALATPPQPVVKDSLTSQYFSPLDGSGPIRVQAAQQESKARADRIRRVQTEIDEALNAHSENERAQATQDPNSWEANARYLLDRCPFTVRQCEGGGPEDLKSSLIVNFTGMQMRLEGHPMFATQATQATQEVPAQPVAPVRWLLKNPGDAITDDVPCWAREPSSVEIQALRCQGVTPEVIPLYTTPPAGAVEPVALADLERLRWVAKVFADLPIEPEGRAIGMAAYAGLQQTINALTASVVEPVAAQKPSLELKRARTLMALLWRRYDTAGISMGRGHESVLLETAMSLLGDPDPDEMRRIEELGSVGDLVDESRSMVSAMRARQLGFAALTASAKEQRTEPSEATPADPLGITPFSTLDALGDDGALERYVQLRIAQAPRDAAQPGPAKTVQDDGAKSIDNWLTAPGEEKPSLWLHTKSSGKYRIVTEGTMESDGAAVVIYQSVDTSRVWVRSFSEFYDGRFVPVPAGEAPT